MKKKVLLTLIALILMIYVALPIYADDEITETDITYEEMNEILETAANLEKIPTINSRYAIVYDRTSRRNPLWERGE